MNNLALDAIVPMESGNINKATILIVDDEESVRKFLKRLLEKEGYICATAEDAEKAICFLLANRIDLVISDVQMPGKSGLQLLEEIKQHQPEVATLIMTGLGDKQIADAAIEKGSCGYLYKPFQKTQVLANVSHALRCRAIDLQNRFEMENFELIIDEKNQSLTQANLKVKNILESIIKAISMAIESRDPYTAGHQQRVAKLVAAIASDMGFSDEHIQYLKMAGIVHDIGKISVPAEILCKPAKLTDAEMNIIKDHPRIGYNILKEIEFPYPLAEIIYQHHERLDGSGYPNGLTKEHIHEDAKILAVADVVEAMISHRPYRPALGIEFAMDELKQHAGRFYDPKAVDVCCRLFEKDGLKLV